ncbi:MAG: M1 family metallopeptidase [Algoriphagus sp.]|uniref:M1 family metallopeptidase n=1 Tax=Algoriphagus sp. TaxID=1872435 RepID=UPI0026261B3F|nr:M1 family metallopeptidase [Algoriphagus sp.]MDG1276131.1 M1 family metallopeptidase [Algoriphagus sp.]
MKLKNWIITTCIYFSIVQLQAQSFQSTSQFSKQDSLRGSIGPARAWWDLLHYHLSVKVDPESQMISGKNTMKYKVIADQDMLQVDLQAPMSLEKVMQDGQELQVSNEGSAYFVQLAKNQEIGKIHEIEFHFSGKPVVAVRPPWDGGFTWTKDSNGLPFIANSNQGIGSSIWWPNRDHPADEPDLGVLISVEVPENLMDVSNGRLIKTDHNKAAKTKTYHWEVKNPINNYGINVNIGDYVHFGEQYQGEKGMLDMDYYVLRENLEKAKVQFKDASRMMEAFEHWFGPYPFYEDGFKLVEAPYLGMEHQSSVTYGNGFANGYRGTDLSDTGWGLKFDFIIIHESGHEWFANNITNKDVADMWVHEGFTAYSENLFLDYFYGTEASNAYVIGTRKRINNDKPIIGPYGVNKNGSSDMYYKGANLLHTIRQIIHDDEKWRMILRGLNTEFYHQTVTSAQIENYISQQAGIDLSPVFDQYLRDIRIPILSVVKDGKTMRYRWENAILSLDMPVRVYLDEKEVWLNPTTKWQEMEIQNGINSIEVDQNFYVGMMIVKK